jgi:asparagine synthase (glutamine-hydrolysing)
MACSPSPSTTLPTAACSSPVTAVGIKPLFWGEHATAGWSRRLRWRLFSPWRSFPKKLDAEGLRDYLAFQTPLAPHTLVRDIHALPPGACLTVESRRRRPCHASGGPSPTPAKLRLITAALVEETDALLARAVKDQLVADVPLGAFLSGGIDSSLVVHYMAQAGRAADSRTFSVRFAEAGFDESAAARAVAERYGTEHHVLDAPQLDAETLAAALADLDQPLADPAYIPTWALVKPDATAMSPWHSPATAATSCSAATSVSSTRPTAYPDSVAKRALRNLIRHGLAPAVIDAVARWPAPSCCSTAASNSATIRAAARTCAATSRRSLRVPRDPRHTLQLWRDLAVQPRQL